MLLLLKTLLFLKNKISFKKLNLFLFVLYSSYNLTKSSYSLLSIALSSIDLKLIKLITKVIS